MDISIKRTLKIAHCLCLFCAIQQRKKAAAISLPQLFDGSWWIRKPRSKKQSAGLFFAVCGRPTCSNPTSSSTKKDPQPKLRVLFGGTLRTVSEHFTARSIVDFLYPNDHITIIGIIKRNVKVVIPSKIFFYHSMLSTSLKKLLRVQTLS